MVYLLKTLSYSKVKLGLNQSFFLPLPLQRFCYIQGREGTQSSLVSTLLTARRPLGSAWLLEDAHAHPCTDELKAAFGVWVVPCHTAPLRSHCNTCYCAWWGVHYSDYLTWPRGSVTCGLGKTLAQRPGCSSRAAVVENGRVFLIFNY